MGETNPNLNPEGGGTSKEVGNPEPKDLILKKFKTQADLEQGYVNTEKKMNQVIEELRLLKEEKGDVVNQVTEKLEAEITELQKQIAAGQHPSTRPKYNPQQIQEIEERLGMKAGDGEWLVDKVRGIAAWDRNQESAVRTKAGSVRAFKEQWGVIKGSTPSEDLVEIAPEINTVIKRYPGIVDGAQDNPTAAADVVNLAEKLHETKVQARKAERELREQEKITAQTELPGEGKGGSGVAGDEKMGLKELEEKYGWADPEGPIPHTPKE